jgi:hypothetical protein
MFSSDTEKVPRMRLLTRLLLLSAVSAGTMAATAGVTWASPPAAVPTAAPASAPAAVPVSAPAASKAAPVAPGDSLISAFNNTGDDAGNDSWLEIDRSFNLAKGDGSPGSDIINEVSGASSGMSPKSANGSLSGTSSTVSPPEADDE